MLVPATRAPSAHLPAQNQPDRVGVDRRVHLLAEGFRRPAPHQCADSQLADAGPEQPTVGGGRPGPPPALLRKRLMLSWLNAAVPDPRSQAHAALRCPSLSMLGPSCWQAHGSMRVRMRWWLGAESATIRAFCIFARVNSSSRPFSITPRGDRDRDGRSLCSLQLSPWFMIAVAPCTPPRAARVELSFPTGPSSGLPGVRTQQLCKVRRLDRPEKSDGTSTA